MLAVVGGAYFGAALMLGRDVPGTEIRAGDVVVFEGAYLTGRGGSRWPRLRRREFGALRKALEEGEPDAVTAGAYLRFRQYLAQPGALRGRDATSPVSVARPLGSGVSQPIVAASDDAALFELLASVGCRMPAGGDR